MSHDDGCITISKFNELTVKLISLFAFHIRTIHANDHFTSI